MLLDLVTVVVLLLCLSRSTPTTSACNVDPPNQCPWYNPALPDTQRIAALVQQLTTPEKIQLMGSMSPAVPRLHVPAYAWWSEAAHGIAWAGIATVFPCSMALGATFDPKNVEAAGKAMSEQDVVKFGSLEASTASRMDLLRLQSSQRVASLAQGSVGFGHKT